MMPCLNSPFPSGGDGVSWDGFRVLAHECSVGFSLYNKGRCYNLGGVCITIWIMAARGRFAGERRKWDHNKFGVGRRKVATRLRAPRRRPGDSGRGSSGSGGGAAVQLNILNNESKALQESRAEGSSQFSR